MIRALLAAAVLATSVGAFAQEPTKEATTTTTTTDTAAAAAPMKKKTRAECKKELGKNAKDKAAMKECLAGK